MSEEPQAAGSGNSPLDRAAAEGELGGVEELDAVERVDDESATADADRRADGAAEGIVPGAISHH